MTISHTDVLCALNYVTGSHSPKWYWTGRRDPRNDACAYFPQFRVYQHTFKAFPFIKAYMCLAAAFVASKIPADFITAEKESVLFAHPYTVDRNACVLRGRVNQSAPDVVDSYVLALNEGGRRLLCDKADSLKSFYDSYAQTPEPQSVAAALHGALPVGGGRKDPRGFGKASLLALIDG